MQIGIREEVAVFEKSKETEVDAQRGDQQHASSPPGSFFRNPLGDQVVDAGGEDHQQQKSPVPPAVKKIARAQEKNVLAAPVQAPVNENNQGQEEEIDWGIE